jgi:hypothetical protein
VEVGPVLFNIDDSPCFFYNSSEHTYPKIKPAKIQNFQHRSFGILAENLEASAFLQ